MKLDESLNFIKQAVALEPTNGAYLDSLGWVYFKLGRTHQALTYLLKAAEFFPDPDATVLPYCLSGGTDNKALSLIGVRGYGFAPLQLPADLDFAGMFHGIDERVPVDGLTFGVRVLDRLLDDA